MCLSLWMFSLSELTDSVLYTITTSLPSLVSFYVIVYWFVRGIVEIMLIVCIFTPTKGCDCIHFFPSLTAILPTSATYNR
jgi:hypothetical protein